MSEMRQLHTYHYSQQNCNNQNKIIRSKSMAYYVVCPDCGYKLLKAGDGSTIEIYCPKCKGKMLIAVKDGKVIVQKAPENK